MSYLPPAERAFDVREPVVIYRLVGRRLSQVYIDAATNKPASAGQSASRLSDKVYWRTMAAAGDQIQERPGTTLLVTGDGQVCPILLAEPRPLEPDTAFVHDQTLAQLDREVALQLVAAGALEESLPRRVRSDQSRATQRRFPEDHPLVVDKAPPEPAGTGAPQRPMGRSSRWGNRGR